MVIGKDTICLLADQKRLKDECKDLDVLHNVNKADMAGTMEVIEEYLRSCHVPYEILHVFTKIICQLYMIHPDQNQYSERKANQFANTQSMNQWQWESP